MDPGHDGGASSVSRRSLLRTLGASGLAGLAGCGGGEGEGGDGGTATPTRIGNYPVSGDTVRFGFNVALSGPYSTSGQQELRGLELAVKHLNEGGGWVQSDEFSSLSGDGLLGKEVDYVVGDTESSSDTAGRSASSMIDNDDVIMLTGGTRSESGLEHQKIAAEKEVIYMATMAHQNDLTGSACNRFSFREMFNSYMTSRALAPVLIEEIGDKKRYAQFFSRNDWGKSLRDDMDSALQGTDWQPIWEQGTKVGTSDFSQYAENVKDAFPDVIILNVRGLDAANALREFKSAHPDTDIVLPLFSLEVAQTAGGAIEGVIGTVAWSADISTSLSSSFREAFREEYDSATGSGETVTPSGPAHVAYTQVMQYASAAERAGSFNPNEIITALEDHKYDAGLGPQSMRACDHQGMRSVPVVKGRPEVQQSYGQYYSLVGDVRDASYPCDSGPAANCSLGGNEE